MDFKGLIKKVVTPVLISGAMIFPNSVNGQTQYNNNSTKDIYISGGGSLYSDESEAIRDEYGSFLGLRIESLKELKNNFRIEAGVGYNWSSSEERKARIIPFTGAIHYVAQDKKGTGAGYAKAGFSFVQARESLEERSFSGQDVGIILGGGVDFNIGNGEKIYTEVLYRSISGEELDIAGWEFSIGLRTPL
ncbi:MAG: hypothetical protein WDZ62_00895 [Candidatus Pacearchaeota archaeon]